MEKITDAIWEAEIPRIQQFDSYKYSIETEDGRILDKAEPLWVTLRNPSRHSLQDL